MLTQHQPSQRFCAEADRQQQRQLTAPVQNIAQHHHAQARAAEQQAQPAEHLERAEVGVLHRVELREPSCRGRQLQPCVAQRLGQRSGHVGGALRRRVHEEEPVARLARIARGELVLGDDEVALQDGAGERRDQPHLERLPAVVREVHRIAELFAQGPEDGGFIGDGGDEVS